MTIKIAYELYKEIRNKIDQVKKDVRFNCKNYDSEKQFCNTYDCDPLQFEYDYEIFVEDYCREFTLDKIKEAEDNKNVKKLQM